MRNRTLDEIEIGRGESVSRTLSAPDVELLAFAAGLADALALDREDGSATPASVQGVGAESLIAHLVNRRLPGAGTTIVEQRFEFAASVSVGDTVVATVVPVDKDPATRRVTLDCSVTGRSTTSARPR